MSSPPILDLGIAGGAAAASRRAVAGPQTGEHEIIEGSGISRILSPFADGESLYADADAGAASNVIELDPQIRRAAQIDLAAAARQRVNPRAVALALRLAETAV